MNDSEAEATGTLGAAQHLGSALGHVDAFIGHFADVARADACVGPVQTAEGHTVIPIATVSLQAGFGMGFGGGSGPTGEGAGSGGGGSGGGRGSARVIAIVDVSDRGVEVQPVRDVTSLGLGLMALVGVTVIALRGRPRARLLRALTSQP